MFDQETRPTAKAEAQKPWLAPTRAEHVAGDLYPLWTLTPRPAASADRPAARSRAESESPEGKLPGRAADEPLERVEGAGSALGEGRPLDRTTRAYFEARFGHDLGPVRLHTGAQAAATAHAMEGRALTVGANIAFAEGQFRPDTQEGRRLLAHELTHTLQQAGTVEPPAARAGSPSSLSTSRPGDSSEQEAERAADAVVSGSNIGAVSQAPLAVYRHPVFKPGQLVVVAGTGFTRNGLQMAKDLGSSKPVAFLKPGGLLKLGEEHRSGVGFYATVMKNKDEAYENAVGFVKVDWIRVADDKDVGAAPAPTFPGAPTKSTPSVPVPPGTQAALAPGDLVVVADTTFTHGGLQLAKDLGSTIPVAFLKPGAFLTLGQPHAQGGGKVFYATVMKSRKEPDPTRIGVVRVEWIQLAPKPAPEASAPAAPPPAPEAPEAYFETSATREEYAYELHFRPYETYLALLQDLLAKVKEGLRQSEAQYPSKGDSALMEEAVLQYSNAFRGAETKMMADIGAQLSAARKTLESARGSQVSQESVRGPLLKETARVADVVALALRLILAYDAAANARLSAMEIRSPEAARLFDEITLQGSAGMEALLTGQKDVASLRDKVAKYEEWVRSNVNKFADLVKLAGKIWVAFQVATIVISSYQAAKSLPSLLQSLKNLGAAAGPGAAGVLALAGGGQVTYTVAGAGVAVETLTAEQITQLIATGAIPVTAMAMSTAGIAGGGPATDIPSFETIRGSGPGGRGVVRLQKGAVVRQGKGGMLERRPLKFERVPRNDAGFDAAKKEFLKNLAKDPEVQKVFPKGSPEMNALEAGRVPEGWEVHHNVPLTARVEGVNWNDQSNLSLLPRWLHSQVTKEYASFLDQLAAGGVKGGEFPFPIFDRFVH